LSATKEREIKRERERVQERVQEREIKREIEGRDEGQTVGLVIVKADGDIRETTTSSSVNVEFFDDDTELAMDVDVSLPLVDGIDDKAGGISNDSIDETSTHGKGTGDVDLVVAAFPCQQVDDGVFLLPSFGRLWLCRNCQQR